MTEEELKAKEAALKQIEVLQDVRQRDLDIYAGRIRREYEKLFPGVKINLREK